MKLRTSRNAVQRQTSYGIVTDVMVTPRQRKLIGRGEIVRIGIFGQWHYFKQPAKVGKNKVQNAIDKLDARMAVLRAKKMALQGEPARRTGRWKNNTPAEIKAHMDAMREARKARRGK